MSKVLQRFFLVVLTGGLLAISGWSSLFVYKYSSETAEIKKDYSELNSITRARVNKYMEGSFDNYGFKPDR